jgi:hypothetical protein
MRSRELRLCGTKEIGSFTFHQDYGGLRQNEAKRTVAFLSRPVARFLNEGHREMRSRELRLCGTKEIGSVTFHQDYGGLRQNEGKEDYGIPFPACHVGSCI